ncbi:MAG TPA: glycine cleavage T C-terminal barrel domain-containing protein, partial [Gemmatimonadales bacterium]|nr:glycine cleavage T C-terminal barrel domain-containing protein [Gemmatimonadales bacterium]
GVSRKLAGVEIAGDPRDLNMTRWPVHARGTQVGSVTSAVYSPRLERNIGYVMVPTKYAKLGTALTIHTPAGEREATVVTQPFVDPKKDVPKSYAVRSWQPASVAWSLPRHRTHLHEVFKVAPDE